MSDPSKPNEIPHQTSGQKRPKRPKTAKTIAPQEDAFSEIGLKARVAALNLVEASLSGRDGFDAALSGPEFNALETGERSFARMLAMTILRYYGPFDQLIEDMTQKLPPEPVLALLKCGLAQIGFMAVPDFAAVSTTLKLAERSNATRPYKGLINAVLRNIIRKNKLQNLPTEQLFPDWLTQRYIAHYGQEEASQMMLMLTQEPQTDLVFKTPEDCARFIEATESEKLHELVARCPLNGLVSDWPYFDEGQWWVQDVAASVPIALFPPKKGDRVLDMCAAPGGKSLQILSYGAKLIALDRAKGRLTRLNDNLKRLGFGEDVVEVILQDGETFEDGEGFDMVLLDAPCSSSGTFRRQPDVLRAIKPQDISRMADLQHRLLDQAARLTKKGGLLIYCTCSLEREEGETQSVAFLRRQVDFIGEIPDPLRLQALGIIDKSVLKDGSLRLLPHHRDGGQDGFFIRAFRRRGG